VRGCRDPPGERERVSAATLKPDGFAQGVAGIRVPPVIPPESMKDLIPRLASSMSAPQRDVKATVNDVKRADVVVRGAALAASVLLRGSVDLKQK